ncbi:MAG: phospho-N-acetylmuramoyl-pentapeptide-transferase [Clostridia bacterium]|jgi:phospho-N-acetylmuramoyl-pentapeptide-transferase|nr:phospho-N-acetylmuramoyl-pentapeptide-transferase [Clostridia bacterium]MDO4381891.1 phospho-N-acetylmuramoyl-pentapeptide-transferase [Clostridia bacterium]MEE0790669.1 phospho-N-acetylmuramoyl-pentapeptide-transferase [Clostridia bacterium]HCF65627.1 phospho-N-acetylmuramoyl-pentapeptide-transferase [Clostridiales bacterium]HJJ10104.1 phospho-N-acetylmuramoyl-pentapeptide-transferase [Clostridiaceae bacterium]
MQYQIKILLLSFVITIITSLAIIPILKKLKVGQMERTEGPQSHLGKQGTPTMGGIIMILVITVLTGFLCYDYIKDNQSSVAKNLIPIAAVSIGFGLVGFIDDFKKLVLKNTEGLKPLYKMIGLLIFSVAFVLYITKVLNIGTETYIPFIKTYFTLPVWLYIPFAILVLLGTSNAVNLTDGIDGLATSVTALILTCLTVIGIIFNIKEIVVFGSITIGTCLGFLLFNLNPAKIFMGDTGSLMLGGAVAGMALYLKMPLLLLIIALVPVIETLSVMIQVRYFKKTGNRIFKMTPIHHHFELSGWNENKIVSIFSIITLMLSVVGLLAI